MIEAGRGLSARLAAAIAAEHADAPPAWVDPLAMCEGDGAKLVAAAVLVPVVLGAAPGVLLTKRTAHLTRHAGQVSFPGGRIDPGDADACAAALREAEEEIGLDPAQVTVLGVLPDHVTGTGYRITPVLATIPPGLPLRPAPAEVAALFELGLDVLLDPAAPQRQRRQSNGVWREFWVWPHPEHFIWGATAAILVTLAQRLRATATLPA
ncbi:MAG: CoA pyrophosphatase [Rhodospirillales bacterium]|nr:CoA pyrophosphatase [Rhodospirillales bacterium]